MARTVYAGGKVQDNANPRFRSNCGDPFKDPKFIESMKALAEGRFPDAVSTRIGPVIVVGPLKYAETGTILDRKIKIIGKAEVAVSYNYPFAEIDAAERAWRVVDTLFARYIVRPLNNQEIEMVSGELECRMKDRGTLFVADVKEVPITVDARKLN